MLVICFKTLFSFNLPLNILINAYINERKIIYHKPSGTGRKTISSSQESSLLPPGSGRPGEMLPEKGSSEGAAYGLESLLEVMPDDEFLVVALKDVMPAVPPESVLAPPLLAVDDAVGVAC